MEQKKEIRYVFLCNRKTLRKLFWRKTVKLGTKIISKILNTITIYFPLKKAHIKIQLVANATTH